MDIKEVAHIDAAEQSDGDISAAGVGSTGRRRLLAAGLSGTALSLVPILARRAGASGREASTGSTGGSTGNSTDSFNDSPTDASTGVTDAGNDPNDPGSAGATPGTDGGFNGTGDSTNASSDVTIGATGDSTAATDAPTTTVAPPKRPSEQDVVFLSFQQSLELTIRDLYDVAIGAGAFEGPTLETAKAIREAHEAYAQSISGLLGREAPNTALADLLADLEADFSGSAADVAAAARDLENRAVATHVNILGELEGVDGAALIASMLIVEARHATVMAAVAGVDDVEEQLTSEADPIELADFTTN